MTARPVRPSVDASFGDHERRIRALERAPVSVPDVAPTARFLFAVQTYVFSPDAPLYTVWDVHLGGGVFTAAKLGADHTAAAVSQTAPRSYTSLVALGSFDVYQAWQQPTSVGSVSDGPFVYYWDGSSWTDIGPGALKVTNPPYGCQLATDFTNVYAVWSESVTVNNAALWQAKVWNGATWTALGTGQIHTVGHAIGGLDAATLNFADPVVAWLESPTGFSQPGNLYVQTWNGSAWVDLGAQPLNVVDTATWADVFPSGRCVGLRSNDNQDGLVVAWVDDTVAPNNVNVRFWNGSSWSSAVTLGSNDPLLGGHGVGTGASIEGVELVVWGTEVYLSVQLNWDSSTSSFVVKIPWAGSEFSAVPALGANEASVGGTSSGITVPVALRGNEIAVGYDDVNGLTRFNTAVGYVNADRTAWADVDPAFTARMHAAGALSWG